MPDLCRFVATLAMGCLVAACSQQPDTQPSWEGAVPVEVEVTGYEFAWSYRFAGQDAAWNTTDDVLASGDLHLPVGVPAEIRLRSKDYIYTLDLPEFGLREVAVPEMTFTIEIPALRSGRYEILGGQMCGYTHETLIRHLVIEPPADFLEWIGRQEG